ncbi:MAG: signal peptidase I [Armatimonadetes bacterium]|nr:signal peptidase I [Armatimonadota bacterium]
MDTQAGVGMAIDRSVESIHSKAAPKIVRGFGLLLIILLVFAVFFYNSFITVQVRGISMYSTLQDGQRLLATRAFWLAGDIKHNDIVVFKLKPGGEYLIKRVYRLGGESVDWLNVPKSWRLANGEYRVPKDMVYVLGDNRAESEDSRMFGPLRRDQILGKVVVVN